MSVLLVEPRCLSRFSDNAQSLVNQLDKKNFSSPPMGIAYLAAVLKQARIPVTVRDLNLADDPLIDLIQTIEKVKPSIVGISGNFTRNINYCLLLNEQIKIMFPEIKTIFGGHHATFRWTEMLERGVDFVVMFEGESTFRELVNVLLTEKNPDFSKISGLAYQNSAGRHINPPRIPLGDLDILPFPVFADFPLEKYGQQKKYPIISARGCNMHCYYCSAGSFCNGRVRLRSVENVAREIASVKEAINFDYFTFYDDNLAFSPKRLRELCDVLKPLGIQWSANCYPAALNRDLMAMMKEAGCVLIFIGVESGSPEILRQIKPGVTREKVREVVQTGRDLGLDIICGFMFPHYSENLQSIEETGSFMDELTGLGATISFTMATPFPGTPLFDQSDKYKIKIFETDWDKFDLDHPVFETAGFDRYLIAGKYRELEQKSFASVAARVRPLLEKIPGIDPAELDSPEIGKFFNNFGL